MYTKVVIKYYLLWYKCVQYTRTIYNVIFIYVYMECSLYLCTYYIHKTQPATRHAAVALHIICLHFEKPFRQFLNIINYVK